MKTDNRSTAFSAYFAGKPVTVLSEPSDTDQFVRYSASIVATGTSSVLSFSFLDPAGYFGLDDISVVGAAVPCFASGTSIATPSGPVAVEMRVAGDRVTLASGGTARIVWVGHRRAHDAALVRIRTHALARDVPSRDLIVTADHAMRLDGVLVPAGLLVNGETIVLEARENVTLWHVELERHGILLAEGAPAESDLDTGNRRQFGNRALSYDPVDATDDPCADLVLAGTRLASIRAGMREAIRI